MPAPQIKPQGSTVSLVDLNPGELCRLSTVDLQGSDSAILDALGLRGKSPVRLCKSGNPWIVEVRGTRIGLADEVAQKLQVERLSPESGDKTVS